LAVNFIGNGEQQWTKNRKFPAEMVVAPVALLQIARQKTNNQEML
jgi:hypothetical protein